MDFSRVKISTTVPLENADALREALGRAGAGKIGEYSYCSFSVTGQGRFIPSSKADPHISEANQLTVVEEEYVEVACERKDAHKIIAALKTAHPYEEPIVNIVPLLDEEKL